MNMEQANKIRKIIRLLGCVCALGAVITAFIFGFIPTLEDGLGVCMAARIFAIVLFVISIVLLVFDLVTKAFSPLASGMGAGLGLIGFIGNFVIAPASTYAGALKYALTHIKNASFDLDTTQLSIGRYMIILAGVLTISYTFKCFKSGT